MNELPLELLDEILVYLDADFAHPIVPKLRTVCRRWNRPYLTRQITYGQRQRGVPNDADKLQQKFPKLLHLDFGSSRDFKGHPCVKSLKFSDNMKILGHLNCPRLTRLSFHSGLYFYDTGSLTTLVNFCQSLTHLEIDLRFGGREDSMNSMTEAIRRMELRSINYQGLNAKTLKVKLDSPDVLSLAICTLFKAPAVKHLDLDLRLKSPDTLSSIMSNFGNPESLSLTSSYAAERYFKISTHPNVKMLQLKGRADLDFLVLASCFPNLVSLQAEECSTSIHLEYPSKVQVLCIKQIVEPLEIRHFPGLTKLDVRCLASSFDAMMTELSLHCPGLAQLSLFDKSEGQQPITPSLDHVNLGSLKEFDLTCNFVWNESFTWFLARHATLEKISCKFQPRRLSDRAKCVQTTLVSMKEPNDIQTTNLKEINLLLSNALILNESGLYWILKHSPNLLSLDLSFSPSLNGSDEIHLPDLVKTCPKLKKLFLSGLFMSSGTWDQWNKVGNWKKSLTSLFLAPSLNIKVICSEFAFLQGHSRLDFVKIGFWPLNDHVVSTFPIEWKPLLMQWFAANPHNGEFRFHGASRCQKILKTVLLDRLVKIITLNSPYFDY